MNTRGRPAIRPTALEWGLLAAGLVLTNHYAWLLDDAFIFFRYADNFTHLGYGLVFNAGEYVEGFSSPAWMLLVSALRTTGLDYWDLVRAVGLSSFAAFWWLGVVLDRELAPAGAGSEDGPARLNLPLTLLCLNYAVLCYFTSGVETPLVQVCALAYALHLARPERRGPALWVGISPLIRPELLLAAAMAFVWTWARTRKIPWWVLGTGVVTYGGWLFFRVGYYADLLPNTFYLKDTANWSQGWLYLDETLSSYGVYPLLIALAVLMLALRSRRVDIEGAPRIAMGAVACAIALYIVRVGGDPRHYRYLAFSFCLAGASLAGLAERGVATFLPAWGEGRRDRRLALAFGVLLAGAVFTRYPPQLGAHPIGGDVPHTMVNGINDAAYHRNHVRLAISPWSWEKVQEGAPEGRSGRTPGARAPVTNASWCEWIYRLPHFYVIHNLGLTDAILARVEIPADRPAHKSGLQPMAAQMQNIHEHYTPGRGMYRLAVEDGRASDWMERNLESIEWIERKMYNRHDIVENFGLAFRRVPRIEP